MINLAEELVEAKCSYCRGFKFLRGGYQCPQCQGTGGTQTPFPPGGVGHKTVEDWLSGVFFHSMPPRYGAFPWMQRAIKMFSGKPVRLYGYRSGSEEAARQYVWSSLWVASESDAILHFYTTGIIRVESRQPGYPLSDPSDWVAIVDV